MINLLKKSNERHDREMIQSKEKVVESIPKATNVTNTKKYSKTRKLKRRVKALQQREKSEKSNYRRIGTGTRSALIIYEEEKGEYGKE